MTDYMKKADRLAQAYADAVLLGEGNDEALSALLTHIQRGAVPEGWQMVPEVASDAMLRPFYECPPEELQLAWQAAVQIAKKQAKAVAPDQFRDAAKMMAEPAEVPMTQAATDVLAERQRQISAEGWTPDHDDEHDDGSLAAAAACYALGGQAGEIPAGWPQSWDDSWWRPSAGERRNLVKAGALILAEIERLDRADAASRKTSWLCPNCPTPDLCLRIQGCDRDEIAR